MSAVCGQNVGVFTRDTWLYMHQPTVFRGIKQDATNVYGVVVGGRILLHSRSFSFSSAWDTIYRDGKEIRQGDRELKNGTGAIYTFYTTLTA